MRVQALLLLLSSLLAAQAVRPVGPDSPLVTGILLERDSQPEKGQFSVRLADNQVFRYRFDAKTYVEREDLLINVPRLNPGEKVEVLSDLESNSPIRYARTVHVIQPPPPGPRRVSAYRQSMMRSRADEEPLFPRGDMALSGVIAELNPGRLVLRTREGTRTVLLRQDTRYLDNGDIVDAAALSLNMRVFIRAGKNIYNEVEGFQVVWGKILDPR